MRNLLNSTETNTFRMRNLLNSTETNTFRMRNLLNSAETNTFRMRNVVNSAETNTFRMRNIVNSAETNTFRMRNVVNSAKFNVNISHFGMSACFFLLFCAYRSLAVCVLYVLAFIFSVREENSECGMKVKVKVNVKFKCKGGSLPHAPACRCASVFRYPLCGG